jgi:hypothetical protein
MSDNAPKIFQTVVFMTGIFGGIFLLSCSEQTYSNSETSPPDLTRFDLSTNTFEVCQSKESEKETFLKFFMEGGYTIPGNPKPDALDRFFEEVRAGYFEETEGLDYSLIKREYHTFTHAMDVMITIHALFEAGAGIFFTLDEKAVLLLAALGHDVLHTGVNNGFLAKIKHPLVQEFGEDGVQEKRSAQFMEKVLDKHAILKKSDSKESSKLSRLLTDTILWTDYSRHKDLMKKVESLIPKIEEAVEIQKSDGGFAHADNPTKAKHRKDLDLSNFFDFEERILLGSFILHCADVSNPGKEWPVAEKWANLVMNEFFALGDLEKSLGMEPSMNCDRETVSVAKCQIGFGQFVIKDLFKLLEKISADGGRILSKNLDKNQAKWKALIKKE